MAFAFVSTTTTTTRNGGTAVVRVRQ